MSLGDLPSDAQPVQEVGPIPEPQPTLRVLGAIGVAEEALVDGMDLSSYSAWMGISTNEKVYPDELVIEYAKWAEEHTGSFTLVVSDWLNRYNWVAQRGDWGALLEGKHIDSLERNAQKRVERLQQLFDVNGLSGGVILWSQMLKNVVENSHNSDVEGMLFLNGEWSYLETNFTAGYLDMLASDKSNSRIFTPGPVDREQLARDIVGIMKALVPGLRARTANEGHEQGFVDYAMSGYALEEIFLTYLLAHTGWGSIKIGPPWERAYDEVSAKYIKGAYDGSMEEVPFGAVYLEAAA